MPLNTENRCQIFEGSEIPSGKVAFVNIINLTDNRTKSFAPPILEFRCVMLVATNVASGSSLKQRWGVSCRGQVSSFFFFFLTPHPYIYSIYIFFRLVIFRTIQRWSRLRQFLNFCTTPPWATENFSQICHGTCKQTMCEIGGLPVSGKPRHATVKAVHLIIGVK